MTTKSKPVCVHGWTSCKPCGLTHKKPVKAPAPAPFDSAKWCWDTADLLAQEYLRFFHYASPLAGMGKLELFYRETTAQFDGTIAWVPSHLNAPLGQFSAGLSTRGEFTREQITRLIHDTLRRLPVLPVSKEMAAHDAAKAAL